MFKKSRVLLLISAAAYLMFMAGACSLGKDDDNGSVNAVEIPAASLDYVVFAWSEQGMHTMMAGYDGKVMGIPYSTLKAQVLRRGNPPEVVTSGVRLEYSFVNNTSSYSKGTYAGFWDNSAALFGVALSPNTGLNFIDSNVHNGLSGAMLLKNTVFEADGVPVTPIDDDTTWSPYQVAQIIAYDEASGVELGRTKCVVGVTDEMTCDTDTCHGNTDVGTVLALHDTNESTTLAANTPVLCGSCHGSLAVGKTGVGSSTMYLSKAVHGHHNDSDNSTASGAECLDCHPSTNTTFNRSTAHYSSDGNCDTCHGDLDSVRDTITDGRVPWANEPKCYDCHTFVAGIDTGTTLYSASYGHGGLSCSACHGPAHAQIPTTQDADDYMFTQYQNAAVPIGSCRVCHDSAKGGGLNAFLTAHGPGTTHKTSCYVCHTTPPTTNNPTAWPHKFQGRPR